MLRMLGRRSVRRSVRRGRREAVRTVRVRKGEMSTSPPEKLTKHLLPCHVRLLDGTDLYCQLLVSYMSLTGPEQICLFCNGTKLLRLPPHHIMWDMNDGRLGLFVRLMS